MTNLSSDDECSATPFEEEPTLDKAPIAAAVHKRHPGEVDDGCSEWLCRHRDEHSVAGRDVEFAPDLNDARITFGMHINTETMVAQPWDRAVLQTFTNGGAQLALLKKRRNRTVQSDAYRVPHDPMRATIHPNSDPRQAAPVQHSETATSS